MKVKRYDTAEFGRRLHTIRNEHGLSMDAFCAKYNEQNGQRLSKSTVSRWETNKQEPMVSTVAAIANFFGVSSLWLLGETDDRNIVSGSIQNSAVVQGNHANMLIVQNGKDEDEALSGQEKELLHIFRSLSVKRQTRLLSFAFELESEEGGK